MAKVFPNRKLRNGRECCLGKQSGRGNSNILHMYFLPPATATLLLHQGKQLSPESMRSFSPDQSHYKTPSRSTLEKETHFFIRQHIEKTRITPKAV